MKHRLLLPIIALFLFYASATAFAAEAKFHIGIVTSSITQTEDAYRGAEKMIKEYGSVEKGGMIRHLTTPDDFVAEEKTSIALIEKLGEDPKMKVIVVNDAVPGTAEAFKRIKKKRPDILCFAGEPHEDSNVIHSAADLIIGVDSILRGYLIIHTAKQLGSDSFVHISFPRHMEYEMLARQRVIMKRACRELGLKYAEEAAPDPLGSAGVTGAQDYITKKVPAWLLKYGKKTSFYCTNDAHTEPLIRQIAKYGGFFIEPDLPSPLMGYPGAFGLNLSKEAGNWPAIMKRVEQAVIAAGGKGRLGTWSFSYGWSTTCALTEYGKRIVEGKAKANNMKHLWESFQKYTPGAKWNGAPYTDLVTGTHMKKYILVYQDTYIFGRGNMNTTTVKVPQRLISVK